MKLQDLDLKSFSDKDKLRKVLEYFQDRHEPEFIAGPDIFRLPNGDVSPRDIEKEIYDYDYTTDKRIRVPNPNYAPPTTNTTFVSALRLTSRVDSRMKAGIWTMSDLYGIKYPIAPCTYFDLFDKAVYGWIFGAWAFKSFYGKTSLVFVRDLD